MTAFNAATIVVFASLGLVALALGLLVRRYSGSALATGLAGLLALTTALTWMTYAGPEIPAQAMNNPKPEIAAGNKELQSSRERIQELEKRVAANKAENDQIRTGLSTAQARLGDAQQEAAKAKAEAGRLAEALQAEQSKLADAIAKVAELEKRVGRENTRTEQPATAITADACETRFSGISKTGAIYFKTGSAELDQESAPLLNSVADIAIRCPSVKVDVEGHSDNVGSKRFNQQLSEQRAKSVVDYLTGKGISVQRIQSAGYGDTRPDAPNDTEANKGKNRRIEFKVRKD
jgi:outer membrane protein OmpA-like peptidoglycan-associated protein